MEKMVKRKTRDIRMGLPRINPTRTKTWKKLKAHHQAMKNRHLRDLFRRDPNRFSTFSARFDEILVDYSKNIINRETMHLLVELARECRLEEAVE